MNAESMAHLTGNYRVINTISQTDKSLVELVINGQDGRVYIKKTLQGSLDHYLKLKKLSHVALPRIYFAAADEKHVYVIEEYIQGEALSALLAKQGCFPEQEVVAVVGQLCSALDYLHENRIIHRDIKPSNILLTADGQVKLIDFDISREVGREKESDTRYFGTKGYAPPEQFGFAQTDGRSDIYALGVTAKELLGENYRGRLFPVFNRCTELDPERRIKSIKELIAKLQKRRRPLLKTLAIALAAVFILFNIGVFTLFIKVGGLNALADMREISYTILTGGALPAPATKPPVNKAPANSLTVARIPYDRLPASFRSNTHGDSKVYQATEATGMFGLRLGSYPDEIELMSKELTRLLGERKEALGFESLPTSVFEKDGVFFALTYGSAENKRWPGVISLRTNSPLYYTYKGVTVGSDARDIFRAYAAEFEIAVEYEGKRLRVKERRQNTMPFDTVFTLNDEGKVTEIAITNILD